MSNVLRGRGSVGSETSARVLDAARRLNYRPNLFARALAEGRAPTLAMVFSNISNPFYSQFAFEAERAARRRDHFLLVCHASTPEGKLDTATLRAVAGRLASGLVVLDADVEPAALLAALPEDTPAVLAMWEDADSFPDKPYVTTDFHRAGQLAAEHLVALGHRRIAVVTGENMQRKVHVQRFEGAMEFLRAADAAPEGDLVQQELDSIAGGLKAASRLLYRRPRPSAILATNDLLALGALQAAVENGMRVPDQLSVIGITGLSLAAEMRPVLTTIDVATGEIAATAVDAVLDIMTRPVEVEPKAVRHFTRPRLILGASTGPPGQRQGRRKT